MDEKDLQRLARWALLYEHNVMVPSEDKGKLEPQMQAWTDQPARFSIYLNVEKTRNPSPTNTSLVMSKSMALSRYV
ncbi:hypothetical protein Y032_0311g2156 [Ancylostoma ceylanicum]|uniref:Uncharacterized protein n=1 Tax=Ancylostoma ceylanicum TaxID=53326 RepID=A0A016S261_9BILA|nr:hypothetical protein Y032_0311g2156 [Ancylostoma ceylanicum]